MPGQINPTVKLKDLLTISIRIHALRPSIARLCFINHTPPPSHPLRLTKQFTPRTLIVIHPHCHPLLALTTPPPSQIHQAASHFLRQELLHLALVIVRLDQVLVMLVAIVVLDLVQAEDAPPSTRTPRSTGRVVAVLIAGDLVGELEVPLEV
jgi:hypothetical protein